MGCAVVDTGCNVNVCGEKWLEEYIDRLDKYDKALLKEYRTDKCFRFGDAKLIKAHKRMKIPGYIGEVKMEIETEVIMQDIPLLLSKTFMKSLRVVIDVGDDRIHWRGGEIKTLKITSTGHYAIDISNGRNFESVESEKNFCVMYTHGGEKAKDKAWKLHRQFAHPSREKLIKLIKDAGIRDVELENELRRVDETCETCIKFKKAPSRPVVSMPMATQFNEMISMDLKIWKEKYFLVMIDMATRYCNACVITSKAADVIIDGVMRHWVALFGAPRRIMSDNGGEFNNEKFRSMCENFNIQVMCTAAESPWSNGVCERLNAVLKNNVLKIQEENKCTLDTALAWAVAARNALHNNHGFSPNQLVFGSNPSIPNIGEDSPVALGNITSSQTVADNLNAMRKSREEFIKADANERIRRALSRNIRRTEDLDVQVGSYVYYKREGEDRWRGPARVIGKDGKVNVVRHGGQIARVHICRLKGLEESNPTTTENIDEDMAGENTGATRNEVTQVQEEVSEDENHDGKYVNEETTSGDTSEIEGTINNVDTSEIEGTINNVDTSEMERTTTVPKCGKRYEVTLADSNEKINVKILSRAGKVTGRYRDCYNYCNEHNGQEDWMDFGKDVSDMREIREDEEIMITITDDKTMEAKRKEITNWEKNEVFEEVDWEGQPTISTRWVVTEKQNKDGRMIKARLVARGFEEHLGECVVTESPTCSKEALRLALSVMLMRDWKCNTIDIKAAYLQGQPISREVFLQPPPEFFRGKVWKLRKTVYGLNDAARAWYETVRDELLRLGMRVCQYEPAMFMLKKGGVLEGIICIHVDDFCWGGTKLFEEHVISRLEEDFLVGATDSGQFKYVGIHINQGSDGISLDQGSYIKSLQQVEMSQKKCQRKDMPLNENEIHQYRSVVGQLNWVGTQTRPDISFDVCSLSMRFGKCTVGDLMEANKVIKRVKTDQVRVFLPVLREGVYLECYSDASFANLGDCGSQGGFVIFLADKDGHRCPIVWKSRKVRRVVKSTLAAETLALLDVAENAFYIRKILEDIGIDRTVPIRCFVDNKSLVDALKSMKMVEDKYLRINMACLKDMLSRGDVSSVGWVSTNQQLANCLTKKGASPVTLVEAYLK